MLIRFNVKNFLSFDERENGYSQEFSMISGKVRNKKEHLYDDGKIKLLKMAAVYGANASGKSNLVKAMTFMRYTVLYGLPRGHSEKYCKVDPDNIDKPSYFEMEIALDGKYYAYGFEVILSQSRFVAEWLVELNSDGNENCLFERNIETGNYELNKCFKEKDLFDKLNVYADDIRTDGTALFLTIMNQNKKKMYKDYKKAAIFRDVFYWMRYRFDISFPNQLISDYSYLSKSDNVKAVCDIISSFGTGITDFKMKDVPIEKVISNLSVKLKKKVMDDIEDTLSEIRNDVISKGELVMRSNSDFFIITLEENEEVRCQTIEFSHGINKVFFQLSEESDGTVRILDLLEILIAGEGKTYVIDELDRCLHPSLTYRFIETFFEFAKKKNIQLIVTTHESRLLDFDLLRRDEICFINKDKEGKSNIYSLEEYNTRFDQKIDKAYLEGRYGGVPIFNSIFPIEEN